MDRRLLAALDLIARAEPYLRDYARLLDNLDAAKLCREIDTLAGPMRTSHDEP